MFVAVLLLAAAAPQPVIRPVIIAPVRPVVRQEMAPITVNLKPDLVVRDIRLEGDKIVHVLIANEGISDAKGPFEIDVRVGLPTGAGWRSFGIGGLGHGVEVWFTTTKFLWAGDPRDYAMRPDTFPYAKMTSVTVTIDAPYEGGGFGIGSRCARPEGCVVELNEANNVRTMARSEIQPWAP